MILCCFLAFIFTATDCFALSSDKLQTAYLSADQAIYDRQSNSSAYHGHIKFQQGTTALTANELQIYDSKQTKQILRIVAIGQRATYSTLPDGKKQQLYAKADLITYRPSTGVALLIGDGEITQNSNTINAAYITVNQKRHTIKAEKRGKKDIKIVIKP